MCALVGLFNRLQSKKRRHYAFYIKENQRVICLYICNKLLVRPVSCTRRSSAMLSIWKTIFFLDSLGFLTFMVNEI